MAKITAYILILSTLTLSMSKTLVIVNYLSNKNYIATLLCENKTKPKNHCNGKCHLKKQLKKQEQRENQLPAILKDKAELTLFSIAFTYKLIPLQNSLAITTARHYHLLGGVSPAVFHPPSC